MTPPARPVVLCLSGIDPTGGAGLQADIEVLQGMGVHALGLVTALTVQDTHNVAEVMPVSVATLTTQWACLLEDGIRPQAIKVGLLPGPEHAAWIVTHCSGRSIPIVVDPILWAGGGQRVAAAEWLAPLLEVATVMTPNRREAMALMETDAERNDLAKTLQSRYGGAVLVTGGDDQPDDPQVWHAFADEQGSQIVHHPRVPGRFRGAGCSLAAAMAGLLAQGHTPRTALPQALRGTRTALTRGWPLGQGRWIPGR